MRRRLWPLPGEPILLGSALALRLMESWGADDVSAWLQENNLGEAAKVTAKGAGEGERGRAEGQMKGLRVEAMGEREGEKRGERKETHMPC